MSNDTATIVLAADDATAAPLVATIRAAVNGNGKYAAYVAAHGVTRETVKYHAAALAHLAYPNDAQVQKKDGTRTRYGNAVQAAGNGLRAALGKRENTTVTDYIAEILKKCDAAVDHDVDAGAVADAVQAWVLSNLS